MDRVTEVEDDYGCGHVIMTRALGKIREIESQMKDKTPEEVRILEKEREEIYEKMAREVHEGAD